MTRRMAIVEARRQAREHDEDRFVVYDPSLWDFFPDDECYDVCGLGDLVTFHYNDRVIYATEGDA